MGRQAFRFQEQGSCREISRAAKERYRELHGEHPSCRRHGIEKEKLLGEAFTILCGDSIVTEGEEQKDDDVAVGSYLCNGRKERSGAHTAGQ